MNVKTHYATAECPKGYWKKFEKNKKKLVWFQKNSYIYIRCKKIGYMVLY